MMFDDILISTIKLPEGRFLTFHDISKRTSDRNTLLEIYLRNTNTLRGDRSLIHADVNLWKRNADFI